jgi:hypothetical protein
MKAANSRHAFYVSPVASIQKIEIGAVYAEKPSQRHDRVCLEVIQRTLPLCVLRIAIQNRLAPADPRQCFLVRLYLIRQLEADPIRSARRAALPNSTNTLPLANPLPSFPLQLKSN